jgi:uncharacterized membrane protein YphA (DoxX/SURF4 family)
LLLFKKDVMPIEQYNLSFAFAIARVILGILFLLQGYDKIFKVKIKNVVEAYELPQAYPFSNSMVWAGTIFTSFAELIGGLLLIAGFLTNYTLYLLGIDLILVVLAMSAMNPLWDMKFVFPRLTLLIFLLIAPMSWNMLSIDHLIFMK